MELAGCGVSIFAVWVTIDVERAHATDALAAVVVEDDRLLVFSHELLVESVQHLEEGHVSRDALEVVGLETAFLLRSFLTPDLERDVYSLIHWKRCSELVLVVTCLALGLLVVEGFFEHLGILILAEVVPAGSVAELVVVTESLAVLGLVLLAEVSAAAFFAVEGVDGDEVTDVDEVREAEGLLEFSVEVVGLARNVDIGPELFLDVLEHAESLGEALFGATHADVFPHDVTEFLVDGVNRALALNGHDLSDLVLDLFFGLVEDGVGSWDARNLDLVGQVILNGIGEYEVSVGEALHERRGAETVGTVVGEVSLADAEETRDRGLEFVVDPDAAHGVVDGGEDHHRSLVGVLSHDLFVHLEEVAVAFADTILAETLDGILEVEENGETSLVDTETSVAALFGGAASHVARNEVAEGWVAALEVEVAILIGDVVGSLLASADGLCVLFFLGNPDAAVVTERLRHKGELGLDVAVNGDTGGVDLTVARVGEVSTFAVDLHGSGAIGAHGIGGEEIGVAVAASSDYHSVTEVALDFASDEVANDDATSATVFGDNDVEHFATSEHLNGSVLNLFAEAAVGTEEELLTGLTAGVESTRNLSATERAVGEESAVLASEGNTLSYALVDDVVRDLGEAVDVGLTSAIVAALDGVVEETVDRVAIVLVVLGSIDTALSSDGVSATRRVLNAEVEYVETHLAESGGSRSASETSANDNDVELTLVGRVNKFLVGFVVSPLLRQGTLRNLGIYSVCHNWIVSELRVGIKKCFTLRERLAEDWEDTEGEAENHDGEASAYDGGIPFGHALPALEPEVVAPANGLEHAPETV